MKFAKELEETAIPEWRGSYFDYKTGKKRLKALAKALRNVPKRETHHPELPLVRDSSNVAQNTAAIPGGPSSSLVNERSPLQSKAKQRQEPHSECSLKRERMASYGSIIGSPPNSPAIHMKNNITPVPSLELPGPAALESEEIDRERVASISLPAVPARSAHPFGPAASTQLAHTGNAYETRPPIDHPVEPDAMPHGSSPRFRRLFHKRNNSMPLGRPLVPHRLTARDVPSPKRHRDDNDVALETYKEADFREAEFFLFLDKELLKIEKFYKTKEDEAKDRLAAIRQQLHIMREYRLEEILALDVRHRAGDYESQDHNYAERRSKETQSIWGNTRQLVTRPLVKSIDLVSEAFERIRPGHVGETSQAMRSLATPDDNSWTPRPNQRDYHRRSHQDVPYRDAKRKMKSALSEHYRGLELLKSYAEANRKAFRKINKKYDKTVNAKPPQRYMNEQVSKSYFNTSDGVDSIMSIVEDLYARYFEKGNRKVAISKLRAKKTHEDAHSGAIIRAGALLAAGSVLSIQGVVEGTQLLYPPGSIKAVRTSFLLQLYGGYFLMFLLAMLFALCTRVFTAEKVNYQFIFELNRRHALGWRQIWEIPSWFLFLFGLVMYLNFSIQAGGETMYRWWPVVLIGFATVIMFLPTPILYHRARKWFLYSMWRLILAGFYDVEYRDFFLGDMFCSLTYAIGGIEIFFCLYANEWDQPSQCASSHSMLLGFLTTLPAIWRANQCLRRYYSTHELFPHIANFGKYVCTVLMYMALSLYRRHKSTEMKGLFIALAIINSIYTSIWDISMDWSLGDPEAKHRWLRKTLAYRDHIWWYYGAMLVDPLLRFNWMFYIIVPLGSQHSTIVSFLIALSEVFRRGIWTLLRVENEHCSNIRNEKASKDFPLPYKLRGNYDEEEGVEGSQSDASVETIANNPTGAMDVEDERKPVRDGHVPMTDMSSLNLDKSSCPLHPDGSTTEELKAARIGRSGTVVGSPGNIASNASNERRPDTAARNAHAQTSPEFGRNTDSGLQRRSTTDSNGTARQRRRPRRQSTSSNMAGSPIVSALHRVGTTMRAAHERDFARRKPVTDGPADTSDEEDDDDSDDD